MATETTTEGMRIEEEMTEEEARAKMTQFLRNVGKPIDINFRDPVFLSLMSLLIQPPKPVSNINSMEHYANARQSRIQNLNNRSNQMLQARVINDEIDINKYKYDYYNQMKINKLISIHGP